MSIGESIFLATYRNPNDQVPALAADPEHFAEVFDDWGRRGRCQRLCQ